MVEGKSTARARARVCVSVCVCVCVYSVVQLILYTPGAKSVALHLQGQGVQERAVHSVARLLT